MACISVLYLWKIGFIFYMQIFFLCAGLQSIYCPSSGDKWLNQKWHPDGTFYHICVIIFNLLVSCFLKIAFLTPTWFVMSIWICLFGFENGSTSSGFGRAKYYTKPSPLFCQPTLVYSNITPTLSRQGSNKSWELIFLKESSLILLSVLFLLNRHNHSA